MLDTNMFEVIAVEDEELQKLEDEENERTEDPKQTIQSLKKWSDGDDENLLNEVLITARMLLNSIEDPRDLDFLMSTIEKAMRRKRINTKGHDSVPVAEIMRQAEAEKEEEKKEEQLPIASLHPDQDVSCL